jgi:predicted dehydrogenase
VVVACPSELHAEVAAAALSLGLHVLVEKPLATTVADGLRLTRLADEAGRKLMVGQVERFNPAVAKVRSLVAEGRIGRVFRIHATRVGPFPTRIRDVGVAVDLAIHDVDVMAHVLDQTLVRVVAESGRFVHAAHEDLLSCLLRFSGGTLGLLDANWLTPEKQRELVLLGEGGMLRASYVTQDVWFAESSALPLPAAWHELAVLRGDAEGSSMRFALRRTEPLRAELEAFVACILDDLPVPITAAEGLRALAGVLAMQESAATGLPVVLPEQPSPVVGVTP